MCPPFDSTVTVMVSDPALAGESNHGRGFAQGDFFFLRRLLGKKLRKSLGLRRSQPHFKTPVPYFIDSEIEIGNFPLKWVIPYNASAAASCKTFALS